MTGEVFKVYPKNTLRYAFVGMVFLLIGQPTMATTSAPFAQDTAEIDKLVTLGRDPSTRSDALEKLKNFISDSNNNNEVLAYALEKMAEIPEPDLEQYFLDVASNSMGFDTERKLRLPAYFAYWKHLIKSTVDSDEQIQLLVQALDAKFEGFIAGRVQSLAVDELCSRGVEEAFQQIVRSIKNRNSFSRGDERIKFCRQQIDILSAYSTRVEALVSVLDPNITWKNIKLITWSIFQLGDIGTEEVQEELAEYALHLQKRNEHGLSDSVQDQLSEVLWEAGWTDERFRKRGLVPR